MITTLSKGNKDENDLYSDQNGLSERTVNLVIHFSGLPMAASVKTICTGNNKQLFGWLIFRGSSVVWINEKHADKR